MEEQPKDQASAPRWGEVPPPERQAELAQRLQAWDQESDHGYRAGPFAYFQLTGSDVYWLAARVAGEGDIEVGREILANPPLAFNLKNLHLEGASLYKAQLQGASLPQTQLQGVSLVEAQLQSASLSHAQLQDAKLWRAQLQRADLWGAQLQGADFSKAYLSGCNLREAKLDGDTLLINISLDEHVKVADVRWEGASLFQINWDQVPLLGDEAEAHQVRDSDGREKWEDTRLEEYQAAVRAYRNLAIALRVQGITEPADRFTYRAQIMQRKALSWQITSGKFSKLGGYLFSLFLAVLTGYGFRMGRIIVAYALIVLAFATAYWGLGFQAAPNLSFWQAIIVSITAFHGRVFANPFTLNEPQIAVTALEAIFGLVIEGVFIAMLTQRFFNR